MIGYIYKIENEKGRIYIGKTFNIKNRINQYKRKNCRSQPLLYNSIVKYGFNSHKVDILYEGNCDNSFLSQLEIDLISKYNSYNDGLNCTIGGDGGFMIGDDNVSKRKDVRKKMSDSKLKFYQENTHPMKDKNHSEESINKIKKARFNQINQPSIKLKVKCLKTGKIYNSLKELSYELGLNYKQFHYRIRKTKYYEKDYEVICRYN